MIGLSGACRYTLLSSYTTVMGKITVCHYDYQKLVIQNGPELLKNNHIFRSALHRPDPYFFSKKPEQAKAFLKIPKDGFKVIKLPTQKNRLGESTIPAMVKREMAKDARIKQKRATKVAELKKAAEEKAAEEAKLNLEEDIVIEEEKLPTNEEVMMKIAGVETPKEVEKKESLSDVSVSEDDEDSFQFDRKFLST